MMGKLEAKLALPQHQCLVVMERSAYNFSGLGDRFRLEGVFGRFLNDDLTNDARDRCLRVRPRRNVEVDHLRRREWDALGVGEHSYTRSVRGKGVVLHADGPGSGVELE